MSSKLCIGIIGGTGQLGGAIAHGLLSNGFVSPEQLWISSRSGPSQNGFESEASHGIQFTTTNQDLIDNCDIVILAVPPHLSSSLSIQADGSDSRSCLIISVMAGVTLEQLQQLSGCSRVIRAMSSPAAEKGLAYSPWFASPDVTAEDRQNTRSVFEAFGQTDEVFDEQQIDHFTALVGPVPGFVAYYADCMVNYAVANGIQPAIADRAIRQLFHASGVVLAESAASPGEQVKAMIDYAGTTAAGLQVMKASPLAASIAEGLKAAFEKSLSILKSDKV